MYKLRGDSRTILNDYSIKIELFTYHSVIIKISSIYFLVVDVIDIFS